MTPGDYLLPALPELHCGVRAHQPLLVRLRDQDGGVEGVCPLYDRPVKVRMAGANCRQPANVAHGRDGVVVDKPRGVPHYVAGVSLDHEGALADGDVRCGPHAEQVGLHAPHVAPVAHRDKVADGAPALAAGRHPLSLVGANGARCRRVRGIGMLVGAR